MEDMCWIDHGSLLVWKEKGERGRLAGQWPPPGRVKIVLTAANFFAIPKIRLAFNYSKHNIVEHTANNSTLLGSLFTKPANAYQGAVGGNNGVSKTFGIGKALASTFSLLRLGRGEAAA